MGLVKKITMDIQEQIRIIESMSTQLKKWESVFIEMAEAVKISEKGYQNEIAFLNKKVKDLTEENRLLKQSVKFYESD